MEQPVFRIRTDEKRDQVCCLDPFALPALECEKSLHTLDELCAAMKDGTVRGAIATSFFAAFSLGVLTKRRMAPDYPAFLASFKESCTALLQASPIPYAALKRMILNQVLAVQNANPRTVNVSLDRLFSTALDAQKTLAAQNRKIAEHALELLHANDTILIHPNSAALSGSAADPVLAPILLGNERHYRFRVFVPEGRPYFTGAKLVSKELLGAQIKHTLIPDAGAANVLRTHEVSCVFLSCDARGQNGDALCEPGALSLALCAKQCGVPVYLLCPGFLSDEQAPTGALFSAPAFLPQVLSEQGFTCPIAPAGTDCFAPMAETVACDAFDAIITENGVRYPPFSFAEEKESV